MKPKFLTFSANPIFGIRIFTYRKKLVVLCLLVGLFFNLSISAQDRVKISTEGNLVMVGNGLLISKSTASTALDRTVAHNCEIIESNY